MMTDDFKQHIAIIRRKVEGRGVYSHIGAAPAHKSLVRRLRPNDKFNRKGKR